MKKSNVRWLLKNRPIENHYTAAWAGIYRLKKGSKVPIPDDTDVIDAKEWVDDNHK